MKRRCVRLQTTDRGHCLASAVLAGWTTSPPRHRPGFSRLGNTSRPACSPSGLQRSTLISRTLLREAGAPRPRRCVNGVSLRMRVVHPHGRRSAQIRLPRGTEPAFRTQRRGATRQGATPRQTLANSGAALQLLLGRGLIRVGSRLRPASSRSPPVDAPFGRSPGNGRVSAPKAATLPHEPPLLSVRLMRDSAASRRRRHGARRICAPRPNRRYPRAHAAGLPRPSASPRLRPHTIDSTTSNGALHSRYAAARTAVYGRVAPTTRGPRFTCSRRSLFFHPAFNESGSRCCQPDRRSSTRGVRYFARAWSSLGPSHAFNDRGSGAHSPGARAHSTQASPNPERGRRGEGQELR
jgi:hypothetical protein